MTKYKDPDRLTAESVREWPVTFSCEMVRAILDGRKTQFRIPITRVKGIYGGVVSEFQSSDTSGYDFAMRDRRKVWNELKMDDLLQRCPFGHIGDRLWVRETWHPFFRIGNHVSIEYKAGFSFATDIYGADLDKFDDKWIEGKWIPSIHMPRWASRLTLEITNVRIQQLWQITADDCFYEGASCKRLEGASASWNQDPFDIYDSLRDNFRSNWDFLHSKKDFGWGGNPWVWVITFKIEEALRNVLNKTKESV